MDRRVSTLKPHQVTAGAEQPGEVTTPVRELSSGQPAANDVPQQMQKESLLLSTLLEGLVREKHGGLASVMPSSSFPDMPSSTENLKWVIILDFLAMILSQPELPGKLKQLNHHPHPTAACVWDLPTFSIMAAKNMATTQHEVVLAATIVHLVKTSATSDQFLSRLIEHIPSVIAHRMARLGGKAAEVTHERIAALDVGASLYPPASLPPGNLGSEDPDQLRLALYEALSSQLPLPLESDKDKPGGSRPSVAEGSPTAIPAITFDEDLQMNLDSAFDIATSKYKFAPDMPVPAAADRAFAIANSTGVMHFLNGSSPHDLADKYIIEAAKQSRLSESDTIRAQVRRVIQRARALSKKKVDAKDFLNLCQDAFILAYCRFVRQLSGPKSPLKAACEEHFLWFRKLRGHLLKVSCFLTSSALLFTLKRRSEYNHLKSFEIKWIDRSACPQIPASVSFSASSWISDAMQIVNRCLKPKNVDLKLGGLVLNPPAINQALFHCEIALALLLQRKLDVPHLIGASKRSCLCCFSWLKAFNETVSQDEKCWTAGTRGKPYASWVLPSTTSKECRDSFFKQLCLHIEDYVLKLCPSHNEHYVPVLMHSSDSSATSIETDDGLLEYEMEEDDVRPE